MLESKIVYPAVTIGEVGSVALVVWWVDAAGILLAIFTSTAAVVFAVRRTRVRVERWFVHGYHAGYHAARQGDDCYGPACATLGKAQDYLDRTLERTDG